MSRRILIATCLIAGLATGLAAAAATAGSPATALPDTAAIGADNNMREVTGPVLYESAVGDFSVTLPPGCALYRERTIDTESVPEGHEALIMTIYTYCDRKGYSNEGCSITAYVDDDLDAGQAADPGFVLQRVEAILKQYGAEIVGQQAYRKQVPDGPLMEGIDVLAADPDRTGQVWVRGLLVEGDVYLLTAWRAHGELHVDPDFVNFFESFTAHM